MLERARAKTPTIGSFIYNQLSKYLGTLAERYRLHYLNVTCLLAQ